jgi:hypothetical protein
MTMRRWTATTVLALLIGWAPRAQSADPTSPSPGNVRFFRVARSSFDRYTSHPDVALQNWMKDRYWRILTYAPYFDSRLSWFPDAWVYKDVYAVYVGSTLANEHPEWILHDAAGNPLYIPYGCSGGSCPQYAGDVGDPGFRAYWLDQAAGLLARGYRGLFVDDVNMSLSRVGDGTGHATVPLDQRTGLAMTDADWRRYLAEFTEAIRARFPDVEVVHNSLWFFGHDDPFVRRQLLSADFINVERGVNDSGVRGGRGRYGFESLLGHIDWLHAQQRYVLLDGGTKTDKGREYGLAAYFLVGTGHDAIGNDVGGTPGDWWPGYDIALGSASGPRYAWQGVLRRDFELGLVLLNSPDAPVRTLELDGSYLDLAGKVRASVTLGDPLGPVRTSITLGPAEGAVLRPAPPPPPPSDVVPDGE